MEFILILCNGVQNKIHYNLGKNASGKYLKYFKDPFSILGIGSAYSGTKLASIIGGTKEDKTRNSSK